MSNCKKFWMEGSFDGNSLKVAELLHKKKGFKEAYAIRGGVAGKNGWQVPNISHFCFAVIHIHDFVSKWTLGFIHVYLQEIQESLLPPSVHVYPNKKKGKKSTKDGNGAIAQPIEDKIGVPTSSSEP